MKQISSLKMRLLPVQRGLRLACALLVFVFQACGNEQTGTPEEQFAKGGIGID